MPKYYCDYCDTFLTHDSTSVRKSHIEGNKHKAAVLAYYEQFNPERNQEKPNPFGSLGMEGMHFPATAYSGGVMPGQFGFPPNAGFPFPPPFGHQPGTHPLQFPKPGPWPEGNSNDKDDRARHDVRDKKQDGWRHFTDMSGKYDRNNLNVNSHNDNREIWRDRHDRFKDDPMYRKREERTDEKFGDMRMNREHSNNFNQGSYGNGHHNGHGTYNNYHR